MAIKKITRLEENHFYKDIRYFEVEKKDFKNYKAILTPEHDNLGLALTVNAKKRGTTANGKYLVDVLFTDELKKDIFQQSGESELNQALLDYFNIRYLYRGNRLAEVFMFHPELDGTTETTDEEGNPVITDNCDRTPWGVDYIEYVEE